MLGITAPTVLGAGAVSAALDRMQRILRRLKASSGVMAGLNAAAAAGSSRPAAPASRGGGRRRCVAWRDVEPLRIVLAAVAVGLLWSMVAG